MTVSDARKTVAQAFKDDPDFRRTYVDNVACVLMDRLGMEDDKERRDTVADEIIRLCFEG